MEKISVIGFGKIGQAIAAHILDRGWQVTAIDNNRHLLDDITLKGFETSEPGLKEKIQPALATGQLVLDHDYAAIKGSRGIVICVPLLVDVHKQTDREPFLDCMRQLAPWLTGGMVLVIETSVPVGFARQDVEPLLAKLGKLHGRDYWLAASPERIKSGTMLEQLKHIPKAIGGYDTAAGKQALELYQHFFRPDQLVLLPDTESAELMKLAGMIYRDVNIALSNQLAVFANAMGISLVDLIPLINADREANLLQPGIGVAGHCTPVYPYFLMENFRSRQIDFTLARESRRINDSMAAYACSLLEPFLNGQHVLILGLSFRPGVKEDALSIAYSLRDVLKSRGVSFSLHDPYYSADEIAAKGFIPCTDIYSSGAGAAILVTMHALYSGIDWHKMATSGLQYLVDGRNQVNPEEVRKAGIQYRGIGRS